MEHTLTTKQSIERVLTGRRKPMSVGEIFEQAFPLTTGLKGRTPKQTYYSILYGEAKKADGESVVAAYPHRAPVRHRAVGAMWSSERREGAAQSGVAPSWATPPPPYDGSDSA
jgi:hypothetical protein